MAVCIGTGSNPKTPTTAPPKSVAEKNEQQADGSNKNTQTTTTTNSDGSTTTTTTITITKPDGTKQTSGNTVVSNNPSGAPGKDESKQEDEKYDLCKQNPNLAICRNSSVSGSCGQIACSGDAIQCATLRAAAVMECRQKEDIDNLGKLPSTGLGNSILGGTDPSKGDIDNLMKGTEIDLSKPVLDASGFLGAGTCLAPMSFSVMGHTVEASFNAVCENVQPLRYVLMAIAYIVVYLMVSGAVIKGD